MGRNMQQMFEHIFDCLYVGYGIHIKSWEIIILFSMCRYAQSCAFISVIELSRIPAYCPKNRTVSSSLEQSISAESVSHAGMRKKRTAGCFLCTCGRE